MMQEQTEVIEQEPFAVIPTFSHFGILAGRAASLFAMRHAEWMAEDDPLSWPDFQQIHGECLGIAAASMSGDQNALAMVMQAATWLYEQGHVKEPTGPVH